MTVLRIFVIYEAKDVSFATQLMTDLREAGAEVITDRTGLQDVAFEQFLAQELPQCQQLIVVQTPEALQSPRVGTIVDTALQYVQQGQMTGVLRMIAPTLDAVEEQAVPLMWATTPAFDASLDYPRALAKLLWNLGLIEIDDIPDSLPSPASYIPPIVTLDLKGSGDKSSVSDTFHAQIPGSLDRPVGPPRKSHVLLRSPFTLFSLLIVLVLAVASVAVFIDQSLTHRQSTLAATNTLIPTPTTIHTPTPHPTPTPTPIPTPTPTPIPTTPAIPTPTPAPILAPTSPPTPTATPTQVVPTCTGSACDGKDPHNAHGPHGIACSNDHAFVVASQLVKYGVVYLWYSSGCSTNWAETLQTGGTTYIANANITRSSDNRHYDSTWYASDVWTVMVYAPSTTTNACGSINNATGGCSGFH